MTEETSWHSPHHEPVHDRRVTDRGLGGKVLTIEERLEQGDVRMGKIEGDLSEVLEIVRLGKSWFAVCGHIGNAIKWSIGLAAPIIAIWAAWKQGAKP